MATTKIKDRWGITGITVRLISFLLSASPVLLITVGAYATPPQDDHINIITSRSSVKRPSPDSPGTKITLRLTFDAGKDTEISFKVTQVEGGVIRVERNGSKLGIVPHVDSSRGNQVGIKVLKIVPVDAREISLNERISEISSFEVGQEPSDLSIGDVEVRVEVLGISFKSLSLKERPPRELKKISQVHLLDGGGGSEAEGRCCVTCSGIQVCGCAVEALCGSCCTGSCCNG